MRDFSHTMLPEGVTERSSPPRLAMCWLGAAQSVKGQCRGARWKFHSRRGPDSSSLVSIQALRAIAALLVFWGHAINAVHLKGEADFPHLYGPFGVDIFFVISGFVMVYSSERLFGQPGAPITFFASTHYR